jgi:PKD repeat protein
MFCVAAPLASASAVAGGASSAIAGSIASVALSQVGVSDTPAATSFRGVDCDPYSTLVGAQSPNADGCGRDARFGIANQNETWCADFAKWVWQQAGVTTDMNTLNAQSASFYDWGLRQRETMPVDGGTPAAGDAVVFYPPGAVERGTLADHVGIVTAVHPGGTVDLVNGDFLGATNIGVEHDTGIRLTSWASRIWRPGEQWVLVRPPAGRQRAVPAITASGPPRAVAGTPVSFRASAAGPVAKYRWTFGDGRGTNVAGVSVSHVYAEDGVYPVTVSATSPLGTVATRVMEVEVTGGSSAVASVPDNTVWYSPKPVDQYVFLPSAGRLAAATWDGTSWRRAGLPGRPDRDGGLAALSYPDPDAGYAMTPHAYYASGGTLTETYLARTGWTSRRLAGRPVAGSAIVADARGSSPEVFFFGTGGRLISSADVNGTWITSGVGGPASTRSDSLALGATVSGPELFYLNGHGLTAAVSTARGWVTAPVTSPFGVAADSPLAAVSAGANQVDVFFVDGRGRLAEAVQEQRGQDQREWQVSELPGSPAGSTALAATSYLLGRPSVAAGPARLGAAVYYLTGSGQPAVTYAASGQPWRSTALPGTATKILGADAYQAAAQPSRVFLSGAPSSAQPSSDPLSLDEARGPGGPWAAQSLTPSSSRLPLAVLLLAAGFLAALGLAAFWLVRRRRARAGRPLTGMRPSRGKGVTR